MELSTADAPWRFASKKKKKKKIYGMSNIFQVTENRFVL